MTYQFSIYSRAEAMFLLQLVREHKHDVTLRVRDTNFFTEVTVHSEYPELQSYFDFMLRRFREEQRQMEALYRRSPAGAHHAAAEPSSPWQHVLL